MAIKYGNNAPVFDIVYGFIGLATLKKIIGFEPGENSDTVFLPNNYITIDSNDIGELYPPVSYSATNQITNSIIVNASIMEVTTTANVILSFYDPTGVYWQTWDQFRINGINIYYRLGDNQSWEIVNISFTAAAPNAQGFWVSNSPMQISHQITQQEWDTYAMQEVIIYEENDTFHWELVSANRYDIIFDDIELDGPQTTFFLPQGTYIGNPNQYFKPTRAYLNCTVKIRDEHTIDYKRQWVDSSYDEWVADGSQYSFDTSSLPSPTVIPLDLYSTLIYTIVEVKNIDLQLYDYYRLDYDYSSRFAVYFMYKCSIVGE